MQHELANVMDLGRRDKAIRLLAISAQRMVREEVVPEALVGRRVVELPMLQSGPERLGHSGALSAKKLGATAHMLFCCSTQDTIPRWTPVA